MSSIRHLQYILERSLQDILRRWLSDLHLRHLLDISTKDLTNLINFATCGANCLLKEKLYYRIDGVAMRSSLAPVLANRFMSHYKIEWLSIYDWVSPSYYTQYVGNIYSDLNFSEEA